YPLSELGRAQAAALGRWFAGKSVARVLASPVERAQETANIIGASLGGVEVSTDQRLTEAGFARYLQGTPKILAPVLRPRWWEHMLRPGRAGGDESPRAMAPRG